MIARLKNSNKILLQCLFVVLLIFPKINLYNVKDSTAGIRIDDFFISIIFFILIVNYKKTFELINKLKFIKYYLLIGIIGIISVLINGIEREFKISSVFYALRTFEYMPFFCIPLVFQKTIFNTIVKLIVFLNAIFFLLQFLGLNDGFSSTWNVGDNGRLFGLYGGPYEAGTALNLLTAYTLSAQNLKLKKSQILILFTMTILTQSRISIMCEFMILILSIRGNSSNAKKIFFSLILTAIIIVSLIYLLHTRKETLNILDMEGIMQIVSSVDVSKSNLSLGNQEFNTSSIIDPSLQIRIKNWTTVGKYFLSNPFFLILGFGPGAFGPALDGGWIRLIAEYGILGFITMLLFLKSILKIDKNALLIVTSFLMNMFFADTFISYKAMTLFIAFIAFSAIYYEKNNNKIY